MQFFVAYALAYIAVGVITGLVFHSLWKGDDEERPVTPMIVGACGSVCGGVLWLSMLMYGWLYGYGGGSINSYSNGPDGTFKPAFWLTILTAASGALCALAVYYLARGIRSSDHTNGGGYARDV
jgi:uncharacterized membrane protein YeaQ/YmgE (transglycosylase-associated protein family)